MIFPVLLVACAVETSSSLQVPSDVGLSIVASSILSRYSAAVEYRTACEFSASLETTVNSIPIIAVQSIQFARNLSKIAADWTITEVNSSNPSQVRGTGRIQRFALGDSAEIRFDQNQVPETIRIVSDEPRVLGQVLAESLCGCEVLDGEHHFLESSIPNIMRTGVLQLGVPPRVELSGHSTVHLISSGTFGVIQTWLDPACDFQPRKILLRLNSSGRVFTILADQIELTQMNGGWIATAATVREDGFSESFRRYSTTTSYVREQFCKYSDARQANEYCLEAPNGTPVIDLSRPQLLLKWNDDRITPTWQPLLKANMDSIIALGAMIDFSDATQRLIPEDLFLRNGLFLDTSLRIYSTKEPYCGINCAYTALGLLGHTVPFDTLLTTDVIPSMSGSSFDTLARYLRDHGAFAAPLTNLSVATLRKISDPVILYISGVDGEAFDHFVLYLGTQGNNLLIYDIPGSIQVVSPETLRGRWNGSGLMISNAPIDIRSIWLSGWSDRLWRCAMFCVAFIIAVGVTTAVRQMVLQRQVRGPLWCKTALAGALNIVSIMLVVGVMDALTEQSGISLAQDARRLSTLMEQLGNADYAQVKAASANMDVIVDARSPIDFQQGHIPNAINCSPSLNLAERLKVFEHLSKETTIIIYCQSKRCGYSKALAEDLLNDGFTKILIYHDGFEDWEKNQYINE